MTNKRIDFLRKHLNVWWLRPESALWDAIASTAISQYEITSPSIDIGCGNGIFSFITAGGNFSVDYDWHINAEVENWNGEKDIYNTVKISDLYPFIENQPSYQFDWGLDIKINLLQQAKSLGFYKNLKSHDINFPLPFKDETFNTIFSNIVYWVDDTEAILKDINRILSHGGHALVCVPSQKFYDYCPSYKWQEEKKEIPRDLMKLVNRNRYKCILKTFSYDEFVEIAKEAGFSVFDCEPYLSSLTLNIWDIGLRPLSIPLIKMANKLSPSDRREIKTEWINTCFDYLSLLYEMEFEDENEKVFYLFVLEKDKEDLT